MAGAIEFVIEEATIERRVVRDQGGVLDEGEEGVCDTLVSEHRLASEVGAGEAVNALGVGVDVALGIDIDMKVAPGG